MLQVVPLFSLHCNEQHLSWLIDAERPCLLAIGHASWFLTRHAEEEEGRQAKSNASH